MYVGRFAVVSPGIDVCRVSSRSFPNRRVVDRDDTLTVGPMSDAPKTDNLYIAYNCVHEGGGYIAVGSGLQVDPIVEKLDLDYPPRDTFVEILLVLDYGRDDCDMSRIAGIVDDDEAHIDIVREDALVVEAVIELTLVATHEEGGPRAFDLDAEIAAGTARELYDHEFGHAVCATAATVGNAVETSFYNGE